MSAMGPPIRDSKAQSQSPGLLCTRHGDHGQLTFQSRSQISDHASAGSVTPNGEPLVSPRLLKTLKLDSNREWTCMCNCKSQGPRGQDQGKAGACLAPMLSTLSRPAMQKGEGDLSGLFHGCTRRTPFLAFPECSRKTARSCLGLSGNQPPDIPADSAPSTGHYV